MLRILMNPRVRAAVWAGVVLAALLPLAQGQSFKFIAFADTQAADWSPLLNTNVLEGIAQAIVDEQADFVMFGGDLVNSPSPGSTAAWTNTMAPVYAAGIPVYPAVGNHDKWAMIEYIPIFKNFLPANGPEGEKYQTYFVQWPNALVIVLNAFNPTNELRLQQAWLDAVLATNTLPHIFVMTHAPAFKLKHLDCLGQYPAERNQFWESLVRAGCRMYLCGHDHFYDHARITDKDGDPENDIHHFTLGTGGAFFYDDSVYNGDNGGWQPVRVYHEQQYGYMRVEVRDYTVSTCWVRRTADGAFEDTNETYTYTVRPRLHLASPAVQPALVWSGPAKLQAAPDPTGTYTNVPNAISPYPLSQGEEGKLFYRLIRE